MITVFVHGLYGVSLTAREDVCSRIAAIVAAKGSSHVAYFNSSRDFDFEPDTEYGVRQSAFRDKTFGGELGDLEMVIDYLVNRAEGILGVERSKIRLRIVGSSLGGTLAILLRPYFEWIDAIALLGSGCGTNGSRKPILSTMFPEAVILDSIRHFRGRLLLVQGELDAVVPPESCRKIIAHANLAAVEHVVVAGANHTFGKRNGSPSNELTVEVAELVADFIGRPAEANRAA